MKKFEGILICTDLDGTLYNDQKRISARDLRAIEYFKSQGGTFTFATGRMPYYVGNARNIVRVNAPIICANGGALYDLKTDEYLWKQEIDNSVLELVEYADQNIEDLGIQINGFDKIYFCKENEAMCYFRKVTETENITCDYKKADFAFSKIVFGDLNGEKIERLEKILKTHPKANDFGLVRSEYILYEILPKDIHKGTALTKLCELLGMDKNKTIAIGDNHNDIGMIKDAAWGVAVGNAETAVKEIADEVTLTNNEGAIARIIYNLEVGKYKF